jgi:hypothetical protein
MSLLRDAQKLALEPAAIEPIVPERTRSVRCRVRRLAFLGRQTINALTCRGISLLHDAGVFVRGCHREGTGCLWTGIQWSDGPTERNECTC